MKTKRLMITGTVQSFNSDQYKMVEGGNQNQMFKEKLKIRCSKSSTNSMVVFSSTGRRPASYCHGVVSVVRPFVRACVRKLFL